MHDSIAPEGLRQAITALDKVDLYGDLDELWGDVAAAWRGLPSNDLDAATPGQLCRIERIAQLAHQLFGVDMKACRAAAAQVILTTRRQLAWNELQRHVDELGGRRGAA